MSILTGDPHARACGIAIIRNRSPTEDARQAAEVGAVVRAIGCTDSPFVR
jgi:hypothetical protein